MDAARGLPPGKAVLVKAPAGTSRRVMWVGIGIAVAGAILAAALLSPFALRGFANGYDLDWRQLSDVAQTYEAASAILSALALFGVSASLLFQARQVNSQRVQVVRGLHFELTKIALSDPETFLPCWRPIPVDSLDDKRQHIYQNLVFSYFSMLFELTDFSDDQMRHIVSSHFRGKAARRYWQAVKSGWMPTFTSTFTPRRRRRLMAILDEEYARAVTKPAETPLRFSSAPRPVEEQDRRSASPGVGIDGDTGARTRRVDHRQDMAVPVIAMVTGLLVGVAWRRRR